MLRKTATDMKRQHATALASMGPQHQCCGRRRLRNSIFEVAFSGHLREVPASIEKQIKIPNRRGRKIHPNSKKCKVFNECERYRVFPHHSTSRTPLGGLGLENHRARLVKTCLFAHPGNPGFGCLRIGQINHQHGIFVVLDHLTEGFQ